ncbi:EamA family transporter RarD [Pseudodesulfovibrio piezophilus]|uniref:Uncharacterized transporter VC_0195 n=1 Tax=Pseudodesulfovibrio piezophilus (strain DSM 21447 / JCM 15486 / C1TLV30) TaxID=1322246 RepID=M1WV68_PSEP2|nr:EamA family transporter RarD [Pseudodesulfovibrio piezophilus]CCH48203.1 Uncharacterized transporter VC_0195 [Pseudodesulfovibrio piezophilus C1TLV30]
MTPRSEKDPIYGFIAALSAFTLWGLLPIYWKQIQTVAPLEILCHRIVWLLLILGAILTFKKRWAETFAPLRSFRNVGILVLSSLCIGSNWLIYVWAVNTNHVLATSLGYYINPLVNVLIGFIIFRERLSPMQCVALGLASLGVINSIANYGEVPWISLALAISFAFYGLLRKIAAVESLPGLFLEAMVLTPAALTYILILQSQGESAFVLNDLSTDFLLVGTGVVTALPLIGFAFGARRLRLMTLGILQYAAPSIAFILGVFLYHEPFGAADMLTFCLIWSGLIVYTGDSLKTMRHHRQTLSKKNQSL